ncbi:malectin domain-containing carbohydrate-binding protein [uncultured Cyclobacterium sp.]|uniref:malectin domain-containing carbohydrate-binding protein n=1 Tax=uncultured Cyclobacterium sp. TaxID=453820 RepID=UPI0030ED8D5E
MSGKLEKENNMSVFKKVKNYFLISVATAFLTVYFINISFGSDFLIKNGLKNEYYSTIDFFDRKDSLTNALGSKLWSSGHEKGDQSEWLINGGGGEFNSNNGNSVVSSDVAKSGKYALKMSINTSNGGGHATRNYRWEEISDHKDLIFTQYFYFPKRIDFDRNNDWFNLIQTKGVKFAKGGAGTGPDQINLPHFVLGLEVRGGAGSGGANYLSLSDLQKFWGSNSDKVWKAQEGVDLPVNKWVKVQIRIIQDRGEKGRVLVWQDDNLIIDTGLRNTLRPEVDVNMYSINAYSDKTYPQVTNIYIDDLSINFPAEIVETEPTPVIGPKVKIVSPSASFQITEGETITFKAEANSDPSLSVSKVEFFGNNTWLGATSETPYNFTTSELKAGEYKIRAKVWDSGNSFSNSEEVTISVIEEVIPLPREQEESNLEGQEGNVLDGIFYNFGGNLSTTLGNVVFMADPGNEVIVGSSGTYSNIDAGSEKLYQNERFSSDLNLKIPVENGKYKVISHHNELWFGQKGPSPKAGQRVFDIYLEGNLAKEGVDLFKVNNNEPTQIEFLEVEVLDGYMDVRLKAKSNNATISGISLIPQNEKPSTALSGQNNFELLLNTGSAISATYEANEFQAEVGQYDFFDSPTTYENTSASKDALFQTERHGQKLNYSIEVPNGTYKVKTFHNELWYGKGGPPSQAGKRVFDIQLEGKLVKDNFDLFIESKNQPIELNFDVVEVIDGELNISLKASSNRATISGISIIGVSLSAENNLRMVPLEEYLADNSEKNTSSILKIATSIYPNPARDQIYVGGDIENFKEFYIHDSFGNLLQQISPMELTMVNDSYVYSLSGIKAGVYFLSIIGTDNSVERLRFIIEK